MATVSGQLKSAAINGKPRDLMDVIFDISPTDTPFLTMCGKAKCSQTLHEWQTDQLVAPAANAALEGADVSDFRETTTKELSNKTQILTTAINVSATSQAIEQKGVSKQYAYQMARRLKELKKDLEFALLSNQLSRAEQSTNARLMRGLPAWFGLDTMPVNSEGALDTAKAPVSLGASTGAVADPNGNSPSACVAGTKRVPTEAMIADVMQALYECGGDADRIMAAPAIRRKLSSVLAGTSGRTRMEAIEKKKVTSTVDVYVSDFGTLKIEANRVQAGVSYSADAAFLLDPQYWKVAYLRGFREEKLAHTGDNLKGHVVVECTLEARNPLSSGMVADLKVSA